MLVAGFLFARPYKLRENHMIQKYYTERTLAVYIRHFKYWQQKLGLAILSKNNDLSHDIMRISGAKFGGWLTGQNCQPPRISLFAKPAKYERTSFCCRFYTLILCAFIVMKYLKII